MDSPHNHIVPLTPALADAVADRLSPEHAREVRELSGLAPRAALRLSLAASLLARAVTDAEGRPIFCMGVEHPGLLTATAQVWMVGTPEVAAHARQTLRCARKGLAQAFAATGAERLEQYIPAWYGTGIRFAERLGFRAEKAGASVVHVVLERRKKTYGHSRIQ